MKLGTPHFIGEKLVEARQARGMKQSELAEKLDVTRQAVSQYESDTSTPSPEAFSGIVSILDLPASFFLTKDVNYLDGEAVFYRSLKSSELTDKLRAETRLNWVARIAAFCQEYIDFPSLDLPADLLAEVPRDPRELSDRQIVSLASGLRTYWKLKQNPISHVTRLLESKGFIMSLDPFNCSKIDALSAWSTELGLPFISMNYDYDSAVRLRFNAAHELGELVLHRYLNRDLLANKEVLKLLEDQAHLFAGAFLLPEEAFLNELYSLNLDSLLQQKRKWKVSVAMQIKYLNRIGVLDDEQMSTFYRNLKMRGLRKFEPYDDQITIEKPVLLKQAIEVMFEEGFQTGYDVLHNLSLDKKSISELANIPHEIFNRDNLDGKLIYLKKSEIIAS